jgi:hypothetical protein
MSRVSIEGVVRRVVNVHRPWFKSERRRGEKRRVIRTSGIVDGRCR